MKPQAEFIPFSDPTAPTRRASGPPLAPLLAGARARGVADGFEWLGIAAILLDDRGEVLHANSGAIELMGSDLYLDGGRLRARNPVADASLAGAIQDAIVNGAESRLAIALDSGLTARIAAMDTLDDDPYQLLRVVAILESNAVHGRSRH